MVVCNHYRSSSVCNDFTLLPILVEQFFAHTNYFERAKLFSRQIKVLKKKSEFNNFLTHRMKIKKYNSTVLLFACFAMLHSTTFAQCAMCKTSVESNLKTGGSIGAGLNTGILYLMTIPYLILIIGGYFFFRKPIDAKIKTWKSKYFHS